MFWILVFLTIFPVIYLLGMIFTEDGRLKFRENFLISLYFIFAFAYFYIFWFHSQALVEYTDLELPTLSMIYGIIACAPLVGSSLPN